MYPYYEGALIWERALIRGSTVFIKCQSLATNEAFLFTMTVCSFSFLSFFFLKSKNKKAAALPFVLAAPLDPEKGMDGYCVLNLTS